MSRARAAPWQITRSVHRSTARVSSALEYVTARIGLKYICQSAQRSISCRDSRAILDRSNSAGPNSDSRLRYPRAPPARAPRLCELINKEMPLKYFRWRGRGRALLDGPSKIDEPISAEIFSVERLEHHAESLAKAQEVSPAQSAGISLRGRLRSNAHSLGRRLSHPDRRNSPGARGHARGRMAGGQLLHRRRAHPRRAARSAGRILQTAAEALQRSACAAIRASTAWRGPSSRTPTIASNSIRWCGSAAPISGSNRSPSASCGPSPSRCGWC